MKRIVLRIGLVLSLTAPLMAQGQRLWVLRSPREMVEYDPATFAAKQTVKVPAEALQSPQNLSVNRAGQMLFQQPVPLPLSEEDAAVPHKVWFWNGKVAATIDQGVTRATAATGSNEAISEISPEAHLSEDGAHLFWFANQARRLQREDVDLSTSTQLQFWQTDLNGATREDLATTKLPDCRCSTGACEDSCPYGVMWAPDQGIGTFFLASQVVAGKTETIYKLGSRFHNSGGKWTETPIPEPLRHVLDAASDGEIILEAVPDTGCCGWANQSDDQTLLRSEGKSRVVFDEFATYRNQDYDVSFHTSNARLSPEGGYVAVTLSATAEANRPIQLAQDGQANPEESLRIRKALAELPAIEVKAVEDNPRSVAYLPHSSLVGWMSEKELLIVENGVLTGYNVATGARRKSTVRVDSTARVFLR